MIHVPVGDEDVTYAQQLTRGQGREIAQIEEKRATLKPEVHIKAWVCEWFIDQMGIKASWHGRSGRVREQAGNNTGNDAGGLPQSKCAAVERGL